MSDQQTIYKYPIPLQDEFEIQMPASATFLHFAEQSGSLCLWARVWLGDEKLITRRFRLAGTGHVLAEPPLRDIGTALLEGGRLVLHLFEMWAGEPSAE